MRALVAAALAAAAVSRPQPPPPAPAPAPRVVRVDVVAADARGRAVATLKPSDFELREDGVVQTIDDVTFEGAKNRGAPGAGRVIALFLDEFHVGSADAAAVRAALGRFVDALAPDDSVTVMKPLDSLFAIAPAPDRAAVREAIAQFDGRKGDYVPRTAFERNYMAGTAARVEQMRDQVTLSAMHALAVRLGAFGPGRKTLVVVSEGFARLARRRGVDRLPTLDTILRSANRFNVAIYPIDPGGAADEGSTAMLKELADETDGRAALAASELDGTLAGALRDAAAYYLLTYRSQHDDDGRFRAIEVRAKPKGVTLRARKGYWALFPDEALAVRLATEGPPPPPKLPPGFDEPWHVSRLVHPWYGYSRGGGGQTRITFVWEPVPPVPGNRTRQRVPARVVLAAAQPDGTQLFEGVVLPAGTETAGGDAAGERDSRTRVAFDVPPGRVMLRMSIQDDAASVIDTDLREVAVRDFSTPVAIGTPSVLRARSALEFRALAGDWDAAPTSARAFSRTEHLLIRVPAYAPADHAVVSVRLLNRTGQLMRTLAVRRAPDGSPDFQADLPLAPFAPSEYVLELSVSSPAGQAKELLPFRIVG